MIFRSNGILCNHQCPSAVCIKVKAVMTRQGRQSLHQSAVGEFMLLDPRCGLRILTVKLLNSGTLLRSHKIKLPRKLLSLCLIEDSFTECLAWILGHY